MLKGKWYFARGYTQKNISFYRYKTSANQNFDFISVDTCVITRMKPTDAYQSDTCNWELKNNRIIIINRKNDTSVFQIKQLTSQELVIDILK